MIKQIRRSIQGKLIAVFSLLIVLISIFTLLYYPATQKTQIKQSVWRYVDVLSDMVAFAAGAALGEGSYEVHSGSAELGVQGQQRHLCGYRGREWQAPRRLQHR